MWRATRVIRLISMFALILLLFSPRKLIFVDMKILFFASVLCALSTGILGWVLYRSLKTGRIQNKNDDIFKSESPNWYWFMILANTLCSGVLIIITLRSGSLLRTAVM